MPNPANPSQPRAWKKPRRRRSGSPSTWRGEGAGGREVFPRAERVIAATRLRTAREIWDLLSPTSVESAAEICLLVSGSKLFVRRLTIDRPPARARWKNALRFNNLGAVIAFMYLFYLAVALGITLPVLLIAFCLDLPHFVSSRWRRLLRRRRHRRR